MDPLFILCVVFFIMLLHWHQQPARAIPSPIRTDSPTTKTEKGYLRVMYDPDLLELTFKVNSEYAEQQIRESLHEHVLVQYLQRNEYKEDVESFAGKMYKNSTVLVIPNIDNFIGDRYVSAFRSLFTQGEENKPSNN